MISNDIEWEFCTSSGNRISVDDVRLDQCNSEPGNMINKVTFEWDRTPSDEDSEESKDWVRRLDEELSKTFNPYVALCGMNLYEPIGLFLPDAQTGDLTVRFIKNTSHGCDCCGCTSCYVYVDRETAIASGFLVFPEAAAKVIEMLESQTKIINVIGMLKKQLSEPKPKVNGAHESSTESMGNTLR